jgi:hypothetical protein
VKIPRLTISGLMALILLVAFDFATARALLGGSSFRPDFAELVVFGALPMANILAIGLIGILKSRREHGAIRPGLVGFEVGGIAALVLFLCIAYGFTSAIHRGVGGMLGAMNLRPGPISAPIASALILLPQVALASLGGWLGRRYKIRLKVSVERRESPEPGSVLPVVAESL